MAAILGYNVAQTNSKILHDPLKCRDVEALDNLLNGFFQLRNGFEVISVYVVLNITVMNHCIESFIFRSGEYDAQGSPIPVASGDLSKARKRSQKCPCRTSNLFFVR